MGWNLTLQQIFQQKECRSFFENMKLGANGTFPKVSTGEGIALYLEGSYTNIHKEFDFKKSTMSDFQKYLKKNIGLDLKDSDETFQFFQRLYDLYYAKSDPAQEVPKTEEEKNP